MEKVISILKKNGYRLTNQRREILELLFEHVGDNLDVGEIEQLLVEKGVSMDTATIYRNLELLFSMHIVHKSNFTHQHAHYGLAHTFEIHYICNKCNSITEMMLKANSEIVKKIKDTKKDFTCESVSIEVYGTCERCRRH